MDTGNIIEARGLSKTFKSFDAVTDLSFAIQHGDVYGFLGQNGAGKSTTIRMLLGLIYPDKGSVYIKGQVFNNGNRHLLQHIGAIIERPDMYLYLTGWENLKMFARLSRRDISKARLEEVLEVVGLRGREQDKVKAYSQGMKQRLGIAIAMVHNPDLLILDEPTNGLDPQGIVEMRNLIKTLSSEHGKTILISSHLLHEIEQIATRMIIIHHGKKVVEGVVSNLLDPAETLMEVSYLHNDNIIYRLRESSWGAYIKEATEKGFTMKMDPSQMPGLNNWLVAQQVQVLEIRSTHSLEAYFLSLTNIADAKAGTL